MKNKTTPKKFLGAAILTICFFFSSMAMAGGYYHIVQKGDTLWDICQKYYGSPWLWPKLWEMNPFITNPNLLEPGDKINLLEDVPLIRPAAKEEGKQEKQIVASVAPAKSHDKWWKRGLDVSGLTNVRSIGYFSREALDPIGTIVSSDSERLILAERDRVVVKIEDSAVHDGDIVWVYKSSEALRDPEDRSIIGYAISILGNLKIHKRVGSGLYEAEVNEAFRDIRVGDSLTTYNPVSSCVVPRPAPGGLETEIIATKDLIQIIGQFAVVYLDAGENQGVKRGNLFEVLKERPGLPSLVIGYLLVLDTRADCATGVVVEAKEQFFRGARVRAIQWKSAPRYLSAIPSCG